MDGRFDMTSHFRLMREYRSTTDKKPSKNFMHWPSRVIIAVGQRGHDFKFVRVHAPWKGNHDQGFIPLPVHYSFLYCKFP